MRVMITGGTGLIGSRLAASLIADNHTVIVLSRTLKRMVYGMTGGVQLKHWDAHTTTGWGHLVSGVDAIVNLAGENLAGPFFFPMRWTKERKEEITYSRRKAGETVVEAITAAKRKPRVLIQASAAGYYDINNPDPQTEDNPPGSDFQAEVCKAWEESTRAVEEQGVRRVVIRTGVVLSTKGGAFTRLVFPFKTMQFSSPLGSGKQWFPWIHIEDQVRAIRWLLETKTASGAYNLAAPGVLTNHEFTKVLGKIMRRPAFIPVPGFVLRLAFGEVATLVLDGWQMIPEKLLAGGFTFNYPEAMPAIENLLQSGQ